MGSAPPESAAVGLQPAGRWLSATYTELRQLAAAKMARESPGQTLQPTALVHEAYLRLTRADAQTHWSSRTHFFADAAEAMRRILIENARRKQRAKRGGGWERVGEAAVEIAAPAPEEKLLLIDECLDELEGENPIEAQVVKLHYFVGLSLVEIAEVLGVAEVTVRRRHAFAKGWLFDRVRPKNTSA